MRFAKLSEDNEWEGEKWYFYVRLDDRGNIAEVTSILASAVHEMNRKTDYPPYEYEGEIEYSPEQCDALSNLEPGYMDYHNFIKDFDLPKFKVALEDCDSDNDILYKGGLMDFGENMYEAVETHERVE